MHAQSSPLPGAQGDVLLMVATRTERQALIQAHLELTGRACVPRRIERRYYYDLGQIGGVQTWVARSRVGTATPGGALSTVARGICHLGPRAVIYVGIAYGMRNAEKRALGDVLVADQLALYEPQRIGLNAAQQPEERPRGPVVPASDELCHAFERAADHVPFKVHFGQLLSGDKLVARSDFNGWLRTHYPDAIGGDMESAGLYIAARDSGTNPEWTVVKGICDWGDEQKHDGYQWKAATHAAQLVLTALARGEINHLGGSMPPELPAPGRRSIAQGIECATLARRLDDLREEYVAVEERLRSTLDPDAAVRLQRRLDQQREQLAVIEDRQRELGCNG